MLLTVYYGESVIYRVYNTVCRKADAYWQKLQNLGRMQLAILLDDEPIGEIILKNIDQNAGACAP